MKKLLILAVLAMAPMAAFAQGDSDGFDAGLTGSIELAYQSKYIWRGFDVFDDDPAVQLTTSLDLFGTGFGVDVIGHRAIGHAHELGERWDYNVYYGNQLFPGETLATQWRVGWMYYNFPERSYLQRDIEELHAILSMPNVTGVQGLVPTYVLVRLHAGNYAANKWFGKDKTTMAGYGTLADDENVNGFAHIFMLDYSFAVAGITPEIPEQVFKLHTEFIFNDGVHPAGAPSGTPVDHDWSNAVFGISTDVDLGYGFTMTPALNYQYSMETTVNTEDELWGTVGLRYSF